MGARLSKTGIALLCLLSACGDARPPRIQNDIASPNPRPKPAVAKSEVIPPWQLWESDAGRNTPHSKADALADEGRLEEAVKAYRDIELQQPPGRAREEAFSRRVGVMLKLGRSRTALEEITQHLKEEGRSAKDISPILALLASYAYQHVSDTDQTLAWLGVALKKSDGRGIVARRSTMEAERVVRTIPVEKFDASYALWLSDPSIAPVFQREKARRAQGARPDTVSIAQWFQPATYGAIGPAGMHESDIAPSGDTLSPSGMIIGVLLPETGKYAEHATRVRQGIELALRDSGQSGSVQLAFADSGGDPTRAEAEYERLARDGVAVVLGPLLVKDTELVAKRSGALRVPIVTFTKRPGITELSPVAFRLGATSENQATELASYAIQQLSVKRFAVLYPQDGGSGDEFATAFRAAVAKNGGEVLAESSYVPKNLESKEQAVAAVSKTRAQAVFIGDTIEGAADLLRALETSPIKDAVLLGPALWDDSVAIRGFSPFLEGAVIVTPFFASSSRPQVSQFAEHYRQAYGREPELLAAQAYDAARIVIQNLANLQSGGGELRERLIPALRSTDNIDGVTGKLTVQQNGEFRRRMSVLRLSRGEVIEVMSGGTVTGFVPDEPKEQQEATKS